MQFKVLRNIGSNTVRDFKSRDLDIDQWAEGQTVDLDEKTAAEMLRLGLASEVADESKAIEAVPATGGDVGAAEPPHKGKHK